MAFYNIIFTNNDTFVQHQLVWNWEELFSMSPSKIIIFWNRRVPIRFFLELLTLLISCRQRQVLVTTDSIKLKLKLYTFDGIAFLDSLKWNSSQWPCVNRIRQMKGKAVELRCMNGIFCGIESIEVHLCTRKLLTNNECVQQSSRKMLCFGSIRKVLCGGRSSECNSNYWIMMLQG